MKRLYLMVTIVTRHLGEKYLNFYLEHELEVQLVTLGRGTVNDAMLDSFGLESHEKAVLFSFVTREKWRACTKSCRLICQAQALRFCFRWGASADVACTRF